MAGLTVSVSMSRLTWLKLKRSSVTKLRTEHMAPGGRDGRAPAPYLRREVVGRGKKKKNGEASASELGTHGDQWGVEVGRLRSE